MKILHLEAGNHLYGGAVQVLLLVEGLMAKGIENLLVLPEGSEIVRVARERSIPFHTLPLAGEADLRFPYRFRKLVHLESPDLVHLHSRRGADILGGLGARWAGVPVVMTRRVDNPEPNWVVGTKYRLFDRVVSISEAIRDVLEGQGIEPSLLRCVRSALDPEPFSRPCPEQGLPEEWGIGPDDPVIGMAAQFIARKGHETLLDAVPIIRNRHPRARFILLGRGPLHGKVNRRVNEEGLEDAVILPGFRNDLPDLLPCMDLLVHPAGLEGLGIILLQAGAAGLPVVASAVGGIPEVVVDGETGTLVPPGDSDALAGAVNHLLSNPEQLHAMGAAARLRVYREFSVAGMVEGNLKVYRELLGPPS